MTGNLLVFGHGYTAAALTAQLLPLGWTVQGTVRNGEKAQQTAANLEDIGVHPVGWNAAEVRNALVTATHVLVSTAPSAEGDPVIGNFQTELAATSHLNWLGYLSTTAVYGDHGGGWVNEQTPLTPATQRGQWRVAAEGDWRQLSTASSLPLHIFRLAGIYGPGRGPFTKVRQGTARRIIKPGQVFSRIHVADIAQVLLASIGSPAPGSVYNLCDDKAAPPEDVIAYAAKLLQRPVPKAIAFDNAELTPMARSFYAESKRVSNALIKSELGITLRFPTYQVGLQSLLKSEIG